MKKIKTTSKKPRRIPVEVVTHALGGKRIERGWITENGQFQTRRGVGECMAVQYDPDEYRNLVAVQLMDACRRVETLAKRLGLAKPLGDLRDIYRAAAMFDANRREEEGDQDADAGGSETGV